jgi:hypothetical protein
MSPSSAIAAIGAAQGSKLIPHEMFVAGATMTAAAVYAYLVYKIAFLQKSGFIIAAKIYFSCY